MYCVLAALKYPYSTGGCLFDYLTIYHRRRRLGATVIGLRIHVADLLQNPGLRKSHLAVWGFCRRFHKISGRLGLQLFPPTGLLGVFASLGLLGFQVQPLLALESRFDNMQHGFTG